MIAPAPPPAIIRSTGTDPVTHIDWVLLSVAGRRVPPTDAPPPLLTAQCFRLPGGKLRFELLTTDPAATGSEPPAYQPPWQAVPGQLFPPRLARINLTMDFFGYTRVKPVQRQWEYPANSTGILRYSTPGRASVNMEEIAFYLQYLRALPTLRLTLPTGPAVEFDTTTFQQSVKAEPLCKAGGW